VTLGKEFPLCRVFVGLALGKEIVSRPFVSVVAECTTRHSAKVASLLSVMVLALSKEALPVPKCAFFAECYDLDTWQSTSLPSVTLGKATSIPLLYLFLLFHPNKQKISHNHHRYHIIIIDLT
jgi:hypothetical protein